MAEWTPPSFALPLWGGTPPGDNPAFDQPVPTLTPFPLNTGAPTAAVIVCPGGGYRMKAEHEAEPVAHWLNSIGVAAFVVDYRVAPYRHPIPLLDARRAIQLVRCNAERWSVDPQRVGILGFSAGGHLASTAGTHDEAVEGGPDDEASRFPFLPNAMILCYPVISFVEHRHSGSMDNLLGENPPEEQRRSLSNHLHITEKTPPTFLWHTANDGSVPVENSLMFASALAQHNVPFDLHVFADGVHGVGLAKGHANCEPWTDLCARWLKHIGFAP